MRIDRVRVLALGLAVLAALAVGHLDPGDAQHKGSSASASDPSNRRRPRRRKPTSRSSPWWELNVRAPTVLGVVGAGGIGQELKNSMDLVAVLGPSGAGKTTLFRCLTGLTRPDAGEVWVNGRDICRIPGRELRLARREVALIFQRLIFQQFNLIRRLDAVQNVLAGRLASLPTWRVVLRRFPRADRQLALACFDRVGLVDRAYARADRLSGGQQQRVAIARALAQEARLIVADEPVASLDPESAATVLETLRGVAPEGVAVVASLHRVHLATAYADRIIALREGRIVLDAPAAQFDTGALGQIYERNGGPAAFAERGTLRASAT